MGFLSSEHVRSGCVLGKPLYICSKEVLPASCDRLGSSSVALPRAHASQGLQVQSRVSYANAQRPGPGGGLEVRADAGAVRGRPSGLLEDQGLTDRAACDQVGGSSSAWPDLPAFLGKLGI